jgi:hypothetical protein
VCRLADHTLHTTTSYDACPSFEQMYYAKHCVRTMHAAQHKLDYSESPASHALTCSLIISISACSQHTGKDQQARHSHTLVAVYTALGLWTRYNSRYTDISKAVCLLVANGGKTDQGNRHAAASKLACKPASQQASKPASQQPSNPRSNCSQ